MGFCSEVVTSRRAFLVAHASAVAAGLASGRVVLAQPQPQSPPETIDEARDRQSGDGEAPTPSARPITPETIGESQKLAGVFFDEAEREQIALTVQDNPTLYARRREIDLPNGLAPSTVFRPLGRPDALDRAGGVTLPRGVGAPPDDDEDLAYARVADLSRWIRDGDLTSERLTRVFLDRIDRYAPKLECVVTVTRQRALEQARRADQELRAGRWRGPLHGIPYGAKDLFDTAGIPTTYGAAPYKQRVAQSDAAVVRRLEQAGAVLVAKTTLGALAYGDVWYGGRTRNPWNTEQGSSGSSAGSAAGTAAGLYAFSLGTETLGSIVSPSMRCGTTGLRPTFGRVPRTGAMALCWSLDKVGPICRSVGDTALVLDAIRGADPGDPSSADAPFSADLTRGARGMRVGYNPAWFEDATPIDRAALDAARRLGVELVEFDLPPWPYEALFNILTVEAAAAFEELTLTDRDDELTWQAPAAWPNTFRSSWFVPAVEFVQAERLRRKVMEMMRERTAGLDAVIGPSFAGSMLLITNYTGHPSLVLRAGFNDDGTPHGISLWSNPWREGEALRLGAALERELNVWDRRPDLDG